MKNTKRILSLLLVAVLLCAALPAMAEKISNTINGKSKLSYQLESYERRITLHYTAKYDAAISYKLIASSGDVKVAKDVVIIPANFVGAARIRVTAAENATCKKTTKDIYLYVAPAMPSNLKTTAKANNTITVKWTKGKSANYYSLVYSQDPKLTNAKEIIVKSGNKATITGLKAGTTYYVAVASVYKDSKWSVRSNYCTPIEVTTTCTVESFHIHLQKDDGKDYNYTGKTLSLKQNATVKLFAKCFKPDGVRMAVKFYSSDASVASVNADSGLVKALKPGTTTITAKLVANSKITASMTIKVYK